jgi:hypothetical protein
MLNRTRLAILCAALLLPGAATAAQCSAASGEYRVPLLELYTSEGCDSCPPADRWLSALPARGYGTDRVVALAFHVDYWNYLGWVDPFARKSFSERQHHVASRNQARMVYTPQFTLNGRDFRRGIVRDDFGDQVAALGRRKAQASLQVGVDPAAGVWAVSVAALVTEPGERPSSQTWLALYENNLATEVTAGENRGKRLAHDFVVRDIAGPFPTDAQGRVSLQHRFTIDKRWKTRDLSVAAFVQNARSGDVLQALALACPNASPSATSR